MEWVDYEDCVYEEDEHFGNYLNNTAKAGTDGSERADLNRHAKLTTAAAVAISEDGTRYATLKALVPSRQTIPRAELWAACCLADKAEDNSTINVILWYCAPTIQSMLYYGIAHQQSLSNAPTKYQHPYPYIF